MQAQSFYPNQHYIDEIDSLQAHKTHSSRVNPQVQTLLTIATRSVTDSIMWAQRVAEATKLGMQHTHYSNENNHREPSEESSHSNKNKKRGSTHRQQVQDITITDSSSVIQDETLIYQQSTKSYLSAREHLNQTQNFIPSSQLIRGQSKDATRNPQKMTIELQNERKNDPLSKTQKYSHGQLKTNITLPENNKVDQSLNSNSSSGFSGKKSVQPHQPRHREESSTRRASQIAIKQSKDEQAQFASLVCQVPQGAAQPQMPQQLMEQSKHAVDDQKSQKSFLIGPQPKKDRGLKTLVLDLDETLVHSSFKFVENADITLPIEIDGQTCTIYVLVRPFVSEFLKRMSKHFELVIFTASLSKYAEPLMLQLDPHNYCGYKLFREHCTFYNNAFVKDLTRLGRNMKDVIIVDNSPVAYLFQPENAIPAVSWYDDLNDQELLRLANLLERLAYEEDVRKIIRTIVYNNKIEPKQESIYLSVPTKHKRDQSHHVTHNSGVRNQNKVTTSQQNGQVERVRQSQPDEQEQQISQRSGKVEVSQSHARYESSDGRQKYAALIQEQMRQKKQENKNDTIEVMMQQVQDRTVAETSNPAQINRPVFFDGTNPIRKLSNQDNEFKQEAIMQNNIRQSSKSKKPIKKLVENVDESYEQHQFQIQKLRDEIAFLKTQHQFIAKIGTENGTPHAQNKLVTQSSNSVQVNQQKQYQVSQNQESGSTRNLSVTSKSDRQKESLDGKTTVKKINKENIAETKSSARASNNSERPNLNLQQHPQLLQHSSSSIQAFLQKQQISLSQAVGQNYSVIANKVPSSTKVASKQVIAINNLAAGISSNHANPTMTSTINNNSLQTIAERRSSSLQKQIKTSSSAEPQNEMSLRGYSSLVSGQIVKERERGHSAHLPTTSSGSVQIRGEASEQSSYTRSSSTNTQQQRAQRKPQILLNGSYITKPSSLKIADIQTTRTSKDSSTQGKKIITTNLRVSSQGKKEKQTSSQPKVEQTQMTAQVQLKKTSQLNIGLDSKEIDLRDLLKMTEKVGVSSTRHHNPDFIAKLENQEPKRRQETLVYRQQSNGQDNNAVGHHDLNSPKYQQNNPQVLTEIMNMTKLNRQPDQSDKMKKLKLVRSDQTNGGSAVRKEPVKSSSRGKPVSARIQVMNGPTSQPQQTSSRENKGIYYETGRH